MQKKKRTQNVQSGDPRNYEVFPTLRERCKSEEYFQGYMKLKIVSNKSRNSKQKIAQIAHKNPQKTT